MGEDFSRPKNSVDQLEIPQLILVLKGVKENSKESLVTQGSQGELKGVKGNSRESRESLGTQGSQGELKGVTGYSRESLGTLK